jgi:hypothetical protein
MALTFTDWNTCDDPDNPTLDWTDADAIRGRQPARYLDAIRQALLERVGTTSETYAYPAQLGAAPFLPGQRLSDPQLGTMGNVYRRLKAIEFGIQRLVTDHKFLNQFTQGDPDGMDSVDVFSQLKYWTFPDLLARCTNHTRLTLPGHVAFYPSAYWNGSTVGFVTGPWLADWVYQQHELLNLLVWRASVLNEHTYSYTNSWWSGVGSSGTSLDIAKTRAINSWSEGYKSGTTQDTAMEYVSRIMENAAWAAWLKTPGKFFGETLPARPCPRDVKYYLGEGLQPYTLHGHPDTVEIDTGSTGLVEGKLKLMQTWPASTATTHNYGYLIPVDELPVRWPTYIPHESSTRGFAVTRSLLTERFDIPGGFTFQ